MFVKKERPSRHTGGTPRAHVGGEHGSCLRRTESCPADSSEPKPALPRGGRGATGGPATLAVPRLHCPQLPDVRVSHVPTQPGPPPEHPRPVLSSRGPEGDTRTELSWGCGVGGYPVTLHTRLTAPHTRSCRSLQAHRHQPQTPPGEARMPGVGGPDPPGATREPTSAEHDPAQ